MTLPINHHSSWWCTYWYTSLAMLFYRCALVWRCSDIDELQRPEDIEASATRSHYGWCYGLRVHWRAWKEINIVLIYEQRKCYMLPYVLCCLIMSSCRHISNQHQHTAHQRETSLWMCLEWNWHYQ
jgi:hypothetical protein